MNQTIKQILTSVAMFAVVAFFVGCAAHPQKVISAKRYNLTFQEDKDYIFSNVYITRKGKEYKIHGSVANRWSPDKITWGKIKLQFTDSNGNLNEEMIVPIQDSASILGPIHDPKPCTRQTHFTAKIKKVLLDNTIRVAYLRD